jgi:hypothetical protein
MESFQVEDHFRDNGLSEHDHKRKGKTKNENSQAFSKVILLTSSRF